MTDPKLRAQDLLSRMTLSEKAAQMMQIPANQFTDEEAQAWAARGVGSFLHTLGEGAARLQNVATQTRLGIPLLFGIDAVRGHALKNGATVFPSPLAMACTWDRELLKAVGHATAAEVAADGLHWTFAPLLCIGRDLRWGRVDETFGESPLLIGEMASAMIRGLQGESLSDEDAILACAKHYIAYGEATGGRDSVDAQVSIRKVRETFLPPFKQAVDAGCATFMTAYLPVDGIPMSAHRELLTDILKDELGFDGFVVTDWDNVGSLVIRQQYAETLREAARIAASAGNDMFMSTPGAYEELIALVKAGELAEEVLDKAVLRILTAKFRLGLFDGRQTLSAFDRSAHRAINERIQEEAVVMLKNDGILPLQNKRVAVIGPSADHIHAMLGDWTYMTHPGLRKSHEIEHKIVPITPMQGLNQLAQAHGLTLSYAKGCGFLNSSDQVTGSTDIQYPYLEKIVMPEVMDLDPDAVRAACKDADVILACVGDFLGQNGEFRDRGDLNLTGDQQALLELAKETGKPLVVVLVSGKPLTVPWVEQNADAVVQLFNGGQTAGLALARALTGETNAFGKLPITFAQHVGQLPVYHNQLPGWHGDQYLDLPKDPLYAFGFGLSYTGYGYGEPKLVKAGESYTLSVAVQNTGKRDGTEIVQVYARRPAGERMTPVKELVDFARVPLQAGEAKEVQFTLDMDRLAAVHGDGTRVLEPGIYTLMIGASSPRRGPAKGDVYTVMKKLPPLIAVVGTNASGKSGLAVELAKRFGGEIVSADSRQVFRGLDLGSGKITPEEMQGVPHHLLDVCEPDEFFSMADFQRLANAAIDGIHARGKLPFLAGGTGLYVDSVADGYVLSEVKPDLRYREHLETFTTPELYQMLNEQLPGAIIDEHNRNRVMRRLEKLHAGDPGHSKREPRCRVLKLGVTWPRETLCVRIDERLTRRMADGMLAEVQKLLDQGVSPAFLRKLGLEYRYLSAYLLGEIQTEAEMLDELSRAIKRFAKRQMTWFKRDQSILWLDMQADPLAQACKAIEIFLEDNP